MTGYFPEFLLIISKKKKERKKKFKKSGRNGFEIKTWT